MLSCLRTPTTRVIISIVVVVSVWIVNRRRSRSHQQQQQEQRRDETRSGKALNGPKVSPSRLPLPIVLLDEVDVWSQGTLVWMPPRFAVRPLFCRTDGWSSMVGDAALVYDDMRCSKKSEQATFAQYLKTCPFLRLADGSSPRFTVTAVKDCAQLKDENGASALFTHLASSSDTCLLMSVQGSIVVSLVLRRAVLTSTALNSISLWDEMVALDEQAFVRPIRSLLAGLGTAVPAAPLGFGKGFVTVSSSSLRAVVRVGCAVGVEALSQGKLVLCDLFTGASTYLTREDVAAHSPKSASSSNSNEELERSLRALLIQRSTEGNPDASSSFAAVHISGLANAVGSPVLQSAPSPLNLDTSSSSPVAVKSPPAFDSITYTNDVIGIRFALHPGGIVREVFLHEDNVVIYNPPCNASTSAIQVTVELIATLPATWEHTAPATEVMTPMELLKHNVAFHFTDWTQHGLRSAVVQSTLTETTSSSLHVTDLSGWTAIYFHESRQESDCRTYVIPVVEHGVTGALFVIRWECATADWSENISALRHFMDNITLSRPAFDE